MQQKKKLKLFAFAIKIFDKRKHVIKQENSAENAT